MKIENLLNGAVRKILCLHSIKFRNYILYKYTFINTYVYTRVCVCVYVKQFVRGLWGFAFNHIFFFSDSLIYFH